LKAPPCVGKSTCNSARLLVVPRSVDAIHLPPRGQIVKALFAAIFRPLLSVKARTVPALSIEMVCPRWSVKVIERSFSCAETDNERTIAIRIEIESLSVIVSPFAPLLQRIGQVRVNENGSL